MTREIKFRAWSQHGGMSPANKIDFDKKSFEVEEGHYRYAGAKPIFMQFTGLRDKNGLEIYEGDIMRHIPDGNAPHLPYMVFWSELNFAWMIGDGTIPDTRKWCEYLHERERDFTIIGNIYENPELLKI